MTGSVSGAGVVGSVAPEPGSDGVSTGSVVGAGEASAPGSCGAGDEDPASYPGSGEASGPGEAADLLGAESFVESGPLVGCVLVGSSTSAR